MAFGIVLVVLIVLLAVAVLVALAGYIYKFLKRPRGKRMEQTDVTDSKTPGIASSKIDNEATPASTGNPPPTTKTP